MDSYLEVKEERACLALIQEAQEQCCRNYQTRENVRGREGEGKVIGTKREVDGRKAVRAQNHVAREF